MLDDRLQRYDNNSLRLAWTLQWFGMWLLQRMRLGVGVSQRSCANCGIQNQRQLFEYNRKPSGGVKIVAKFNVLQRSV